MWSYFEGRQEERGKEQPKRESKTQIHEILQEKKSSSRHFLHGYIVGNTYSLSSLDEKINTSLHLQPPLSAGCLAVHIDWNRGNI